MHLLHGALNDALSQQNLLWIFGSGVRHFFASIGGRERLRLEVQAGYVLFSTIRLGRFLLHPNMSVEDALRIKSGIARAGGLCLA